LSILYYVGYNGHARFRGSSCTAGLRVTLLSQAGGRVTVTRHMSVIRDTNHVTLGTSAHFRVAR